MTTNDRAETQDHICAFKAGPRFRSIEDEAKELGYRIATTDEVMTGKAFSWRGGLWMRVDAA